MGQIIIDSHLQLQLEALATSTEVRTSDGRLLGHFTPARQRSVARVPPEKLFDLKEAERIAATERDGIPLAEAWRQIRSQGEM